MKVLVLGAGGQGGPCTSILSRDPDVSEIRLADVDVPAMERVAAKIGCSKVTCLKVNATEPAEVADAATGTDVVIDLTMPWMAPFAMNGALSAKAHYVNSAFDTPFWDELITGKELSLQKEFQRENLTALLGCGMAPGFINVMARLYIDELDTVESIKFRLGKKKTGGGPYDDIIKPWNPGWAPAQALIDCAAPPCCFRNGMYEKVDAYSGIEEWSFSEPIGSSLVSHHSHEEPYSIPRNTGKGLKYCDFKYYVSYHPAALVSLGLASDQEIDVKGVKIKPLDVVTAVLPKAGNAFLDEDPAGFAESDTHAFVEMMIEIQGFREGKAKVYMIRCPKMTAPAQEIYDLFGTSLVNVALPVVIGAKLITEGTQKGVIFAEQLDPNRFIEKMKGTGYPYHWEVKTL